jgi:hypothetical protein
LFQISSIPPPPPLANSFVIGTAVINTHTRFIAAVHAREDAPPQNHRHIACVHLLLSISFFPHPLSTSVFSPSHMSVSHSHVRMSPPSSACSLRCTGRLGCRCWTEHRDDSDDSESTRGKYDAQADTGDQRDVTVRELFFRLRASPATRSGR